MKRDKDEDSNAGVSGSSSHHNNGNGHDIVNEESDQQPNESIQKAHWKKTKHRLQYLIGTKLTNTTIPEVSLDLFKINLIRYQGLLVRIIMNQQLRNISSTAILSSLVSILNSKIPDIGELLINRLILQFRKNVDVRKKNYSFIRYSSLFICHLVNQRVVNEILVLQIIQKLFETIQGESIDIIVRILCVTGQYLTKNSNMAINSIFQNLMKVLNEQSNYDLKDRSIKQIEMILQIRKNKFNDYPIVVEELDLVEDEDKETHAILFDSVLHSKSELNVFHYDEDYDVNEKVYYDIAKEILGDDDEEEEEEEVKQQQQPEEESKPKEIIKDMTESELLEYQKKVYLTIKSSLSADEAVHKLLKLNLKTAKLDNDEIIIDMIIKCCAQEKTYSKFYGLIGIKLCLIGKREKKFQTLLIKLFKFYYCDIEKFETNGLRNLGKFFGSLFASDKIPIEQSWNDIRLTENDTNSASRILLKFIFQEMIEELGIDEVKDRLIYDDYIKPYINGIFPVMNVDERDGEDIRFSINYFTAIGLGVLTEEMRSVLNDLPAAPTRGRSRSRSSSYSRSGSGSGSGSDSRSRSYSRSVSYSRSPSRDSQSRSRSRSRSGSYSRSPSRTPSRSPMRKRGEEESKGIENENSKRRKY
ncbi:armadillo-type protein [Scheffersomyces coipomensis]|uniref:armadillo-type protein n=1 Tax=Scheffersomyces coipomensis TaxID=1788519 RepID=UPI00315D699A